jgi:uncharacterized membrane protein
VEQFEKWMGLAATGVEVLAVGFMLTVILVGTVRWFVHFRKLEDQAYQRYRMVVGKAMLIGLELMVAADIIRTMLIEPTLLNMAVLASLVGIRTFLGWSLSVEIEGHWPWKGKVEGGGERMEDGRT